MRPLFLLLLLPLATLLAAQEKRYALVIGNGDYTYASLGQTPVNDARAMTETLQKAGFEVTYRTNLDLKTLNTEATAFGRKIKDSGAIALFYYSGHGVQRNGLNYLVPIGAELADEDDIDGLCVPIDRITSRMQNAGVPLSLLILDACRSYPLRRDDKNLTKGLAELPRFPEMFVAYATAPGSTSTTAGESGLSLYTAQLLKNILPGRSIETVFKETRKEVVRLSNGRQRPEETGNITYEFYFLPDPQKPAQQDPTPPTTEQPIRTKPQNDPRRDVVPPPGPDADFDGLPDATDLCPNEVGSEKAGGCPDADDDGVPDKTDKCKYDAGEKRWQGCPDTDGDGVPDHEDGCPTQKGAPADKGCPPPDRDRDGVGDATDRCPDQHGLARFQGCPDRDQDGLPDQTDLCPDQSGPARFQGCPDTDGDGLPDPDDACPNDKGSAADQGCPPLARLGLRPNDFVRIAGGTFTMGSTDGSSDEKPTHSVTVSTFSLYKYEVTIAQFKVFVDNSSYQTDAEKEDGSYIWDGSQWTKKAGINWRHDERGNSRPPGEYKYPVVHVSWNDATAYCQWLSVQTGQTYRLPTEAEWEYAAGNGAKHTKYSWGNSTPSGKQGGNIADETAKKTYSNWSIFEGYTDGYVYAAPVGSFNASELNLYDMSGNVWEWCSDWYGGYPSGNQTNPAGAASGAHRVLRGGGWRGNPENCRAADRGGSTPQGRNDALGFRVAASSQ